MKSREGQAADPLLDYTKLLEISDDRYDTPMYGQNTIAYLEFGRSKASGSVDVFLNEQNPEWNKAVFNYPYTSWHDAPRPSIIDPLPLDTFDTPELTREMLQGIKRATNTRITKSLLPFQVSITPGKCNEMPNQGGWRTFREVYRLEAEEVQIDKLATAWAKRYPKDTQLSGAIGKIIDILGVASGKQDLKPVRDSPQLRWVEYGALIDFTEMHAAAFHVMSPESARQRLTNHLSDIVLPQLASGRCKNANLKTVTPEGVMSFGFKQFAEVVNCQYIPLRALSVLVSTRSATFLGKLRSHLEKDAKRLPFQEIV